MGLPLPSARTCLPMMKFSGVSVVLGLAVAVVACESTGPDDSAPHDRRPTLELGIVEPAVAGRAVILEATSGDDLGLDRLVVAWGDGVVDSATLSGTTATTSLQHTYTRLAGFRVEASVRDEGGHTTGASLTIHVGPAAVIIDPAAGDTINALGFTTMLTARALDALGAELTEFAPEWEALDAMTATVGADGLVTAISPGVGRIRAVGGAAADTASVVVRQVPTKVVLSVPDTLAVRESRTLRPVVTDSNAYAILEPEVTWTSSVSDVATVGTAGRLAGTGEGTALIIATAGPVADTAAVDVALGLLFAGEPRPDHTWEDLFTMTRHGTVRRNITSRDFDVDHGGTWSPDRTRIAFQSTRNGSVILVVNATGSDLVEVPTGLPQPANDLAWSPDGGRIAFASRPEDGTGDGLDLYVIDIDGTGLNHLTSGSADHRHPAWSPDGARIAFTSIVRGENTATTDILVMDADGSNIVNLTAGLAGGHSAPVWSPDGAEIAFTSGLSDPGKRLIHRMSADGSDIRQIGVHHVNQFDWSPEGLFVFATEDVDGQRDIFSMPADGGELTRITNDTLWEQDVRWR